MVKVSVCIPTYNSLSGLKEVIESLKGQTFQGFEALICDDASEDGTWEFLQGLSWDKMKLLRNDVNLNLPATLTRLVTAARGDYIAFQHDHEPSEPRWLETMLNFMEERPKVGFAGCRHWTTDSNTGAKVELPENPVVFPPEGILSGADFIRLLATMTHTPFNPSGAFFRASLVRKAGGYNDTWFLASDEDFYRRIARWSDVGLCRERLQQYRPRPQKRTRALGSWRGMYNNFAFRKDTSRNYWEAPSWEKMCNLARLNYLEKKNAWRHALSLCIHGNRDDLLMALAEESRPPIPLGARPFGRVQWSLFAAWVYTLAGICRLTHLEIRSPGSVR
jgi:glycosyltransferase involved in cell wall biosynthesis